MPSTEREDLQELLSIPGWAYFLAHLNREYGEVGYRARMRSALASGDPLKIKLVEALATEMEAIVRWPSERVRDLLGDDE